MVAYSSYASQQNLRGTLLFAQRSVRPILALLSTPGAICYRRSLHLLPLLGDLLPQIAHLLQLLNALTSAELGRNLYVRVAHRDMTRIDQ